MNIEVKIKRFNPETGESPYYDVFKVKAAVTDRVLDLLVYIKDNLDQTLGFRKSCAHGVCGSDAMIINNKERLACKTLVKDVTDEKNNNITIEPLNNMKVERDLIVNQDEFFDNYKSVKPYLITDKKNEYKQEIIQTQDERKKYDDPTKCILCAACYSSCPIKADENKPFIGPAAAVQAARFVFDSRDKGFEERLDVLDDEKGVWACKNHFNCTKVCPREIKITKNINMIKREIKKWQEN